MPRLSNSKYGKEPVARNIGIVKSAMPTILEDPETNALTAVSHDRPTPFVISRSDPMHVCSEPEEGCTRVLEANEAEIGAKVESVSDHGDFSGRTVHPGHDLGGGLVVYAICPKCECLHKPRYSDNSSLPIYPQFCRSTMQLSGTPCNGKLLDKKHMTPVKKFVYNSTVDFIARLLSQESTERLIEKSCKRRLLSPDDDLQEIFDIFDAEFIRRFKGGQPGKLFVDTGRELRLVFCLSIVFPGAGRSCTGKDEAPPFGVIALTCLNLPEAIRYKDEHTCVAGIIPGPVGSDAELGHYLTPLVDEFLTLWNSGVYFSRTASAEHGRLARAAIAVVTSDLLTARRVSGLFDRSPNHVRCLRCYCPEETLGDVSMRYPARDADTLRCQAVTWRDAKSRAARRNVTEYGIRWSELWRLPYWDPTDQIAMDPSHCLLLGLARNHFETVFPSLKSVSEDDAQSRAFQYHFRQLPSRANHVSIGGMTYAMDNGIVQSVSNIHKTLLKPITTDDSVAERANLSQNLVENRTVALLFVLDSLGLAAPATSNGTTGKQVYADALTSWRFERPLRPTAMALMKHMEDVIARTSMPSFVQPVPRDFGFLRTGAIQAEQWLNLSTIHLPIALISYSSFFSGTEDESSKMRLERVVQHTMELIQAFRVLFKRSIRSCDIRVYDRHIRNYIQELEADQLNGDFALIIHSASHVKDFAQLFGPIYSWWTPPFERLARKLESTQLNEGTEHCETERLSVFLAESRAQHQSTQDIRPPGLSTCFAAINGASNNFASGQSWYGPLNVIGDVVATPEVLGILNNSSGQLWSACEWNGVRYSARGDAPLNGIGDSQVCFRPKGCNFVAPGFIECIVAGSPPIFIIRQLLSTPPEGDPFVRYADAPMAVFGTKSQQPLEAVDFNSITGHFAAFQLGDSHFVVIPLSAIN